MTMPPYAPPSKTAVVDTAALKRLEPFLYETVEQFDVAVRYARRTGEEPSDEPGPDGSSMRATPGVLERLSVTDRAAFLEGAAQLFVSRQTQVRGVFDAIVEMRQRYEKTEDDNTTEIDRRLTTERTAGRAPRDEGDAPRDPFSGQVKVPRFRDVSDVLTDPTTLPPGVVMPVLDLGSPSSIRGKAMEALGPSIAHVSERVDEWALGTAYKAATSATCLSRLGRAAHLLRARVEAAFDYVRAVWASPAAEAATNTFAITLVDLEDLQTHLTTMAAYEHQTAQQLKAVLAPTPELAELIKQRYLRFLEADDGMMSTSVSVRVPTKAGFWVWLAQLALVTSCHVAFNNAYQHFCTSMESGYRSLRSIREQYTQYVRSLPACPVLMAAYPEMPSRY